MTSIEEALSAKRNLVYELREDWLRGKAIAKDAKGFFVRVGIKFEVYPDVWMLLPRQLNGVRIKYEVIAAGTLRIESPRL